MKKENRKIKSVRARQLIDCKRRPIVEVDVVTEGGALGRGAAPTGVSVGTHEACALRDGNPDEYRGLSVHKAVKNVNDIIAPNLIGMDVTDQAALDGVMLALDGSPDKSVLGGNAVCSASVACLRAAAATCRTPLYEYIAKGDISSLPIPSFNMINGGLNDGIRQAFNEFIIAPYRAESIERAVEVAVDVFQRLGDAIKRYTGKDPAIGRSFGWAAPSEDPEVCLELARETIELCGASDLCAFALDCAASGMYDAETKTYYLNGKRLNSDDMIGYVKYLTDKYDFIFIEDILDENDWEGFKKARKTIDRSLILADDLTATNKSRLQRAADDGAIDGFILKPNQAGTVTETFEAYNFAKERGMLVVPSGRSGGVVGDVIMDLAVGLRVPIIKNGCPRSGERIDKLNFLMRIKDLRPDVRMAKIDDVVKF